MQKWPLRLRQQWQRLLEWLLQLSRRQDPSSPEKTQPEERAPQESNLLELVDRARGLQPLHPRDYSRRSNSGAFGDPDNDPADADHLWRQYEDMLRHPAWQDFSSRAYRIEERFKMATIVGTVDRLGEDATPITRASYAAVAQIMAIPAQIKESRDSLVARIHGQIAEDVPRGETSIPDGIVDSAF